MDLATVAGLFLGLAIILASLIAGGVPIGTIVQPEALILVFGGTFTALLINFSLADIQCAFQAFFKSFREEELTADEIVEVLTDAAIYIRSKGLLAVQPLLSHVDIPYLQKGLQMLVDNHPTDYIRNQLTTELEVNYQADSRHAEVFQAAGGFSPTMGIIGAIIGLIQVMGVLTTPDKLGHGVANAFIATLYGVGIANLVLLPIAGKLKQRAKHAWFLKSIIFHGLMAIREGHHPMLIREQLETYIKPNNTSAGYDTSFDTLHLAHQGAGV